MRMIGPWSREVEDLSASPSTGKKSFSATIAVALLLPLLLLLGLAVSAWFALPDAAQGQGSTDYDTDNDRLIEVSSLAQLNAIRWDPDGAGSSTNTGYATAFPGALSSMGCPSPGCMGYELDLSLDMDTNGSGGADSGDDYWNGGSGWEPIGDDSSIFNATFEGNGHTISNLFIKRTTDVVGLFGSVGVSSAIRNTGLVSVKVTSTGSYVGGLVGKNRGSVAESYATGSVSGDDLFVGGLAGRVSSYGGITRSFAHVTVTGGGYVGGLAGRNEGATIHASFATGSVTGIGVGVSRVGGLTGYNTGTITESYATGSVKTTGYYSGGLVGRNQGAITASYATGSVTSSGYVGGLVGRNYSSNKINASYATGSVSSIRATQGGLVGFNEGTVTNSYWDKNTSGKSYSSGGIGKATSELQSPTGYSGIYQNWDVDTDGSTGGDNPWDFGTSTQYPALREFRHHDYDTDSDGLIEVSSLAQLNAIRWDLDGDGSTTNTGYTAAFSGGVSIMGCPSPGCKGYELTADLDFDTNGSGVVDSGDDYWNGDSGWEPIGDASAPFSAIFDGNGHTISNLYIFRVSDYLGLFGNVDKSGAIGNLN